MESDRKVVIDVETTGVNALRTDRVISIGMVEIVNNIPTGRNYYQEFNPVGAHIEPDSYAVHGLSLEYLKNKPTFDKHAQEIIDFIGNAPLIIHNIQFDTTFLRKEFELMGLNDPLINNDRICTVRLSRSVLPIYRVSLDKVAKYFGLPVRTGQHNALEDAKLLAKVYYLLSNSHQSSSITETTSGGLLSRLTIKSDRMRAIDIIQSRRLRIDARKILKLRDKVSLVE